MIAVDFETEAIVGNPLVNPPTPVGCAVYVEGMEPHYMAWGHPTENNTTYGEAYEYLDRVMLRSKEPLVFHNAPFDLAVYASMRGYCDLNWRRIHDTQYLLFLRDPYSETLSLKPSAERYLGIPPIEQDAVKQWILENVQGAKEKDWGAHIAKAPGELVGKYAKGDVIRTMELLKKLLPRIQIETMEEAYDRERRMMPVCFLGTRRGIRLDLDKLEHHYEVYQRALAIADDRLRNILQTPNLDLDKGSQVAEALERCNLVSDWVLTPTGKRSTAKDNLRINDPVVENLYAYRNALAGCLSTFMGPWIEFSRHDGRLHPNWNQVRTRETGDSKGTRTGRLSSDHPNFQNVPTDFKWRNAKIRAPEGLVPLPQMREYCLPEEGHVWIKRDFSSQEVRILAHFEDGQLAEAYRANPDLDPHQMGKEFILAISGVDYERKDVKITGFSIIYGSGVTGLSGQLGRPYDEAWQIKEAYLEAFPGIRMLMRAVQDRGNAGQPIRTWGGRLYFVEPSKLVGGQMRNFSYKLLNYLIQGSAADQTKEAICDWFYDRPVGSEFLATVHDEINISAPADEWEENMACLREHMDKDRFDVPMRSEGLVGEDWFHMTKENEYAASTERARVATG